MNDIAGDAVAYDLVDEIAVLRVQNPPVNALSHAVRSGLVAGLERAETEARAVVILGDGRTFPAGADISEFGKPPKDPWLPDVCNRIEASPLPVVAALHGTALGGGLEVAMAAHYRVAVPGARVGLPEVHLGIIPGAGGTQRLPRLAGAEAALDMITSGRHVPADEALRHGILDEIGEDTPEALGLAFARRLLAARDGPRRTGDRPAPPPADFDGWYDKMLARGRGQRSPAVAVRAVQAASELPFAEGLERERALFQDLHDDPQRAGLVHAFFGERAVSKLPELAGVTPRPVETVGVVGGGTMGSGIATALLLAGLPVTLIERDAPAAEAARGRVMGNLDGAARRGKLSPEARARADGALVATTGYDALGEADMVIEAVFEDMDVKQAVFAGLDRACRPGAVLATNTSYLDINALAAGVSRPGDVLGLHFFSPAHVMRLLEIVPADATAPEVTATGFALARRLGKVAVRAGICDGFIGNRLMRAYRMAADLMVLDGATPYEVDEALTAFGFAMGPFAVADMAGLDIGWTARKRLAAGRDPRQRMAGFPDRICEMGRFGQKTGRGYYLYEDGARQGRPDPEILELIAAERAERGIAPRRFTAKEIQRRYMAAMVNEAARLLDEGIARRPLDIDMVLIMGYGFPRFRGGPMKWADLGGLGALLGDIRAYAAEDPVFWAPAPLLERLVAEGRGFEDLGRAAA